MEIKKFIKNDNSKYIIFYITVFFFNSKRTGYNIRDGHEKNNCTINFQALFYPVHNYSTLPGVFDSHLFVSIF